MHVFSTLKWRPPLCTKKLWCC